MNCKPGDLAVIVRAELPENIGLLVHVQNAGTEGEFGWEWLIYSDKPTRSVWISTGMEAYPSCDAFMPDAWLRPIRDPGDDAKDETLDWLPVPKHEKETA